METTRVFTYATNRDGSVAIGAPKPGEFFQAEDSGKAIKRKSDVEPRMLRRILEERKMSVKVADEMDIEPDTIFNRTGQLSEGDAGDVDGEFFITKDGMIAADGVAKWSADEGRELLSVVAAD